MRIAVLGPLRVDGDAGRLSRRDRVVLSVLAMRRPGFVGPSELADALWPVHPPSSWAKVIQGCVVRLRRELGADAVETTPNGYRLAVEDDEVDAVLFESAVERAQRLVDAGDVAHAHTLLDTAVALWQGPALPDLAGWPPGEIEASRLEVVGAEAKELLVEAGLGAGREAAVLPTARLLVEELPLSEHRAMLLARALYLSGEQSQALAALRALRRKLRDEGLDPAPSVGALERAILSHDADLAGGVQTRRAGLWEQPPLPTRWGSEAPTFVGRQPDVRTVDEAWQAVEVGARRVLLIAGDAGAGKSRLVAEVGVTRYAAGAVVLLGQCSPELERPYQPFVEPVRVLVDAAATGDLGLPAGTRARTIERAGHVVGARGHPADAQAAHGGGPLTGDQISDAVVQLVQAAARLRPVVLILEDLHWAGAATLELLEHLVAETPDDRLLVLATHRNSQPDRSEGLVATVARLGRVDGVQALELAPLSAQDIATYVTRELGATPAQARRAGALLREQSAGNPFLLREIVRDLVRNGGLSALGARPLVAPAVLRDTYELRLAQLDAQDRRCLETAAVIGQEFDIDVAAAAAGTSLSDVLRAVDAGSALGIIDSQPSADGRLGFVHEIARQAVQQLMRPGSLIAAHLSVAEALEAGFPDAPDITERLAHHFAAAHSMGRRDSAQKYLRKAARLATDRLAHADAAAFLERAIELSRDTAETHALRLEASAARRDAGDYPAATDHASAALGSPDPLTHLQAAIEFAEASFRDGMSAEDAISHLQLAMAAARDVEPPVAENDPLVIRASISLARALGQGIRLDEHAPVLEDPLALARASGDAALLVHALEATVVQPPPAGAARAEVRLARARELTDLARRVGDTDAVAWSAMSRAVSAYCLGLPDEVREAKAVARAAAQASGTATAEQIFLSQGFARAMELGDLDRAERLAEEVGSASRERGRFEGASATQRFLIERERLGLERMRSVVTGAERSADVWAPGMLALYRELGMRESARRLLDEAMSRGLGPWRSFGVWELTLVFFVECILWLSDADLAQEIKPHLELLSGRSIVLGPMIATFGAADRYLGSVEALLGSPRADGLLADAVELDRSMDAPLHQGYSLVARLAAGNHSGRRRTPDLALRSQARELADELGVPRLSMAVRQVTEGVGP